MVVVKWYKIMQNRVKVTSIFLSALGQSQLYPWKGLKVMLAFRTLDQALPLFLVPLSAGAVPLTDSVAKKHLKDISRLLGFQKPFTFHDFRCGGATWAFRHGGYPPRYAGLVFFMCLDVSSAAFFYSPCGCLFSCSPLYMTTLYWVFGDLVFSLYTICLILYCSLLSYY